MHGRIARVRRISCLAAAIAFMTGAAPAMASVAEGTVEVIQAGHGYTPDNVYVLVTISGQRDLPGCAGDPRLAFNPTTPAGKVIMAILLSAKASGTAVRVHGTGDCGVMNGRESISYVLQL